MQEKIEMSMMGELNFFLGLQVRQIENGIFISQTKYTKELIKKFGMENCSNPKQSHHITAKRILKYLKGTHIVGLWYAKDNSFNLIGYSDADYAGCKLDKKITSGSCQFLGDRLISWCSKKQTSMATSTIEAEYLAAGSCCAQQLWMQQQLRDYGIEAKKSPIFCHNTNKIAITFNPILHSRNHFLRLSFLTLEIF
ncbi:secreted RxLR effector protein 161-like [Henckelia pumila]|uniref:secreted RxLR effector protein 161-like n=1 Tax=Henckelia pumila TaxID=405737 RepID=UPI003C6E1D87